MKTPLSFYLVAAVAGTLACSDEGGTARGTGGSGPAVGQAGSGAGGASGGAAGSGQGMSGAGGGSSSTGTKTGPALTISADGTVKDEAGTSGINGGALTVAAPMGTTINSAFRDGALCINGNMVAVPNSDYSNYWGGLVSVDLNRVANPDATGGGADAGSDAGAGDAGQVLGLVPQPWNPATGKVVGFSFKLDGPMIPPNPSLRFQATPTNSNPSNDHFCYTVPAVPTGGGTVEVKFTQIVRNCYDATPGASVFQDPAGFTELQNINWQVSSSDQIPITFDFCVSELKPILSE
jgi:hypothetical protein